MNEHISFFNKEYSYKEIINKLSREKLTSYNYFSLNNNNDTLNILLSLFLKFNSFIVSIYESFIKNILAMNKLKYKIEFIILLLFFLFSLVISYEEKMYIPTHLLISAYFPSNSASYLSFDNSQIILNGKEEEEENNNLEDINFDELNELIKEKINKIDENIIHCTSSSLNSNNQENSCIYDINNINENIINTKIKEELLEEIKNKISSNLKTKLYKDKVAINFDEEYYLKKLYKKIIITFFSFVILHLFIKYTLNSRMSSSFIYNLFFLILSSYILFYLNNNELYLASNFFFILVIYTNKNFLDSIYIKLNFKRKDFEIFSTSLMAFDLKQLFLKSFILIESIILSGILSIWIFPSFLNYIIFFICIFTFIVFISNSLEPIVPYFLKPIKNLVIFSTGIFNFIFSKLILKNYFKSKEIQNIIEKDIYINIDTLYLVSELFTIFCFDYIRGYLDFQIEMNLMIDNLIDNNKEEAKIKLSKVAINQLGIWIFLLWTSMLIGVVGIFKNEYICLFMSVYLSKLLMNYFCNLYDVKLSKYLYYLHIFLFLIINLVISSKEDTYLINLFSSFININKDIVLFIVRFTILLTIIYYIVVTNIIIYKLFVERIKHEREIKRIKKDDKNSNIYHIEVENIPLNNYNISKCIKNLRF